MFVCLFIIFSVKKVVNITFKWLYISMNIFDMSFQIITKGNRALGIFTNVTFKWIYIIMNKFDAFSQIITLGILFFSQMLHLNDFTLS